MKILIDFEYRVVRLTNERVRHIQEHPEMVGLEHELELTLQSPELVVRSQSDESVLLYYKLLSETRVGTKWLCTVVKQDAEDAFVLTAYLTEKPKKGEILWPSR